LKRQSILLLPAGILVGLVASACSERNPAYIQGKADASLPKDATLLPDKPVGSDSAPSTPDAGPPDSGVRVDARADARDGGSDASPEPVDGFASSDVAELDAVREVGEEGDLGSSGGDGSSPMLDTFPDTQLSGDSVQDAELAPDGPEGDAPDVGVPSLDGNALDTPILDTPIIEQDGSLDLPEGSDGAEGDAIDDGLPVVDGEADVTPDEELVASPSWVALP